MAKRQLTPEFRAFLGCLNRAEVNYLLVGGYAVNHYGYHRFTEDIDFWVEATDENFSRLLTAIRLFFDGDLAGLDMAFLKNNDTLYLGRVPNKIEVIQNASGLQFDQADARRLEARLDGIPVRLISLSDLRANKLASGRHKDLADLENLPEA
jgi:Nucleotidyl transferase AbiEii toxin, Type IV TA system